MALFKGTGGPSLSVALKRDGVFPSSSPADTPGTLTFRMGSGGLSWGALPRW